MEHQAARSFAARVNGNGGMPILRLNEYERIRQVPYAKDLLLPHVSRVLFVWGSGPGGRAWQRFLSVPGKPYLEIQAGLARTRMEQLPLAPRTEWSWLEAYIGRRTHVGALSRGRGKPLGTAQPGHAREACR
jgi:hypothetical protein